MGRNNSRSFSFSSYDSNDIDWVWTNKMDEDKAINEKIKEYYELYKGMKKREPDNVLHFVISGPTNPTPEDAQILAENASRAMADELSREIIKRQLLHIVQTQKNMYGETDYLFELRINWLGQAKPANVINKIEGLKPTDVQKAIKEIAKRSMAFQIQTEHQIKVEGQDSTPDEKQAFRKAREDRLMRHLNDWFKELLPSV